MGLRRTFLAFSVASVLLGGCGGLDEHRGTEGLLQLTQGPKPADVARDAIDPWNPDRRRRGTLLLATAPWAGSPVYIELYVDNVDDPDPAVRAAAARALAAHGEPEHALLILEHCMKHPDPFVRVEAVRALQRLHNPAALTPLLEALREPDPGQSEVASEENADVRAEAADALGQYADNRVVRALIPALADRSLSVARNALVSLRTLTGQDFGYDRRVWLDWFNESQDAFAARAAYVYPVYRRSKRLYEYLPFIPPPPNEIAASPAGLPQPGAP